MQGIRSVLDDFCVFFMARVCAQTTKGYGRVRPVLATKVTSVRVGLDLQYYTCEDYSN